MLSRGLQVTIVPTNDCHFDEYVPDRYKIREYLSGFDGSAGTLVVGLQKAALWTDSRYFLQAEKQLAGSGIELMRLKMSGTPSIPEWIRSLQAGIAPEQFKVGVDGDLFSYTDYADYCQALAPMPLETFSELEEGQTLDDLAKKYSDMSAEELAKQYEKS